MQHDRSQRNVAANGNLIAIRNLLCRDDIHVFIDGNRIRAGFAHGFYVSRCVSANEERRECPALANMRKQVGKRFVQELAEVLDRNLRHQRVDNRDHVHSGFHIVAAHALAALGAVRQKLLHIVFVVVHIHKDIVAAQVARERKRAADQAVERGGFTNRRLHAAHRGEHHRNTPVLLRRKRACARHGHRGFQRMRFDRRGAELRPNQLTAEHLCLKLQVKDNRLAIRLIELVDLQQRINQRILVRQHLGCVCTNQFTRVNAGKRNPRRALRLFVSQRSKQDVFGLFHRVLLAVFSHYTWIRSAKIVFLCWQ